MPRCSVVVLGAAVALPALFLLLEAAVFRRSTRDIRHGGDAEGAIFSGEERLDACTGRIPFPRAAVAGECEGYWRGFPAERSELPWPNAGVAPFCGQRAWSKRLAYLEALATEAAGDEAAVARHGLEVTSYRGLSLSRIDERTFVGNKEFRDAHVPRRSGGAPRYCWPDGYREHYVDVHFVVPSEEFYRYVLAKYAAITAPPPGDEDALSDGRRRRLERSLAD